MSAVALSSAAFAFLTGAICVYFGVYDVAAVKQHTKPVYWLIETAMRRSVHMRASGVRAPKLDKSSAITDGFEVYHGECERCHGGPGVSPERYALGLMPVAANLTLARQKWDDRELYWIISNGLKMTAMPAWKHRLSEPQIWHLVVFIGQILPTLTPTQYAEALGGELASGGAPKSDAPALLPGDSNRGRRAIQQYACITCHEIPGITGAVAQVGPPLNDIGSRTYIAGKLLNRQDSMVAWLMAPSRIKKGTAMPDLAINEQDARDIAAYLATLGP
jgi:mono/diheme cytochrome c family protein